MSAYLRFVGVVECIGYAICIVILPISGLVSIPSYILFIIFGLALAILCFSVAGLLERNEGLEDTVSKLKNSIDEIIEENRNRDLKIASKVNAHANEDILPTNYGKLSAYEISLYKIRINSEYVRFPFDRYSKTVKEEINAKREVAVSMLDKCCFVDEAEVIVKDFEKELNKLR